MGAAQFKVLIVDDSPDDRFFIQRVLEKSPKFVFVGEARDGVEAIEYLQGSGERPDLVLLDLKMPRKNGFDVLQWIQGADLGKVTVAVMSGSRLTEDIDRSMALGAHAYFKKSSSKDEQDEMVRGLEKLLQERHPGSAP
jgi:DNA-binding NarL/FixJ family response regulator